MLRGGAGGVDLDLDVGKLPVDHLGESAHHQIGRGARPERGELEVFLGLGRKNAGEGGQRGNGRDSLPEKSHSLLLSRFFPISSQSRGCLGYPWSEDGAAPTIAIPLRRVKSPTVIRTASAVPAISTQSTGTSRPMPSARRASLRHAGSSTAAKPDTAVLRSQIASDSLRQTQTRPSRLKSTTSESDGL